MTVYLDTSVIVALLTQDRHSARAETLIGQGTSDLVLSDLATAEFASVTARRVRERLLTIAEADAACAALDRWAASEAAPVDTVSSDIRRATLLLRRRDLDLRTQDAIHIALTERLGANMATFDAGLARAARQVGVPVVDA